MARTEQKDWLFHKEVDVPPAWLSSNWDINFFLLLDLNWSNASSWVSSLPDFRLELYHQLCWVMACQFTLKILGLVNFHDSVSQIFIINISNKVFMLKIHNLYNPVTKNYSLRWVKHEHIFHEYNLYLNSHSFMAIYIL